MLQSSVAEIFKTFPSRLETVDRERIEKTIGDSVGNYVGDKYPKVPNSN